MVNIPETRPIIEKIVKDDPSIFSRAVNVHTSNKGQSGSEAKRWTDSLTNLSFLHLVCN
ncbi:uncharacterized protein LACBIDRAFT_302635 [Laccaria bicolor S238N-H82]|uniref:Predicted protein n=1 Tax=Laccaria bicolor (strain S238N-H82 / ATCC MYA-4686) TaxID=486041 RepID=B0DI17_LACBS|nr:uncharacterized protein LACBIDRAFT_302635 [Laccaria bicolor S238N-H82]EDR05829.1 predicted protein [Laccaria bicolor S238N-H82]|eukprot:XP_001883505.1 predicted protein [Laccaria bicolor S238N-H82]